MNNIGFGIMCFGDDYYFTGAKEKMNEILKEGFCYVLTDDRDRFKYEYDPFLVLSYDRIFKSYYDKMLLVKHILKYHDICILIDADAHISDYSFLNDLKTHKFNEGITYTDVLFNHPEKKKHIMNINMTTWEWKHYHEYATSILRNFVYFELMWEYFMVFNKNGFNQTEFYKIYEKLQIAKEYCELKLDKDVYAPGEGISISIASKLSNTPCQRDIQLYNILKDKMSNVSRKFMRNDNQ